MNDLERFELLNSQNWDEIFEEWITIARRICCSYGITDETIINGKSLNDMVQEIVKKLYSGDRSWDPEKVPLKAWFIITLKSEISNLRKNHAVLKEDAIIDSDDYHDEIKVYRLSKNNQDKLPEDQLISDEEENELNKVINELSTKDDRVFDFMLCLAEYPGLKTKPNELAKRLGIPESEIYQINRKIKRNLTKKLKEIRNDE